MICVFTYGHTVIEIRRRAGAIKSITSHVYTKNHRDICGCGLQDPIVPLFLNSWLSRSHCPSLGLQSAPQSQVTKISRCPKFPLYSSSPQLKQQFQFPNLLHFSFFSSSSGGESWTSILVTTIMLWVPYSSSLISAQFFRNLIYIACKLMESVDHMMIGRNCIDRIVWTCWLYLMGWLLNVEALSLVSWLFPFFDFMWIKCGRSYVFSWLVNTFQFWNLIYSSGLWMNKLGLLDIEQYMRKRIGFGNFSVYQIYIDVVFCLNPFRAQMMFWAILMIAFFFLSFNLWPICLWVFN